MKSCLWRVVGQVNRGSCQLLWIFHIQGVALETEHEDHTNVELGDGWLNHRTDALSFRKGWNVALAQPMLLTMLSPIWRDGLRKSF